MHREDRPVLAPPTLRLMQRHEMPIVSAFHAANSPHRSIPALLEWEFFDPALVIPGFVVSAWRGEELVGTQAFIPYMASIDGESHLTVKSELTLAAPEYRGHGLCDAMYKYGFDVCERAGVSCVWGFTSAVKPLIKSGFDIGDPLISEDFIVDPIRTLAHVYRRKRRGVAPSHAATPRPPANPTSPAVTLPNAEQGSFALIRDARYFEHRYTNNPNRRLAHVDEENGVVFSASASSPYAYVSEVVSTSSILPALRAVPRGPWSTIRRICTERSTGPAISRAGIRHRSPTNMNVVFQWIGTHRGRPMPTLNVEEGLTEGVVW